MQLEAPEAAAPEPPHAAPHTRRRPVPGQPGRSGRRGRTSALQETPTLSTSGQRSQHTRDLATHTIPGSPNFPLFQGVQISSPQFLESWPTTLSDMPQTT